MIGGMQFENMQNHKIFLKSCKIHKATCKNQQSSANDFLEDA